MTDGPIAPQTLARLSKKTTALALKLAREYFGKPPGTSAEMARAWKVYMGFHDGMIAEGFDKDDAFMLAAIINDMGSIGGVKNLLKYFAAPVRPAEVSGPGQAHEVHPKPEHS